MAAPPELADGLAEYIETVRAGTVGRTLSLEQSRLIADRDAAAIAYPRPQGMTVVDSFVVSAGRETPVRIYRPTAETRAALVYLHGGGFTTGSIESYDALATALAEAAEAVVISVGYRRLPEATTRALLDEAVDTLAWTVQMAELLSIDRDRIGVAGDSAGAFIATQLVIAARDGAAPLPCCQLLCYGMFDIDETRTAYREAADPVLPLPVLEAIIQTYRDRDRDDPAPPPPLQRDDLHGLPPTIILAAEHDRMREENAEYEDRLRAHGVTTTFRVAQAMPHGFLRAVRFSEAARDEMQWLGNAARPYLK